MHTHQILGTYLHGAIINGHTVRNTDPNIVIMGTLAPH